jgi:hypothetical protein
MEIFSYHDGLAKWVEIGNSGKRYLSHKISVTLDPDQIFFLHSKLPEGSVFSELPDPGLGVKITL